MGRAFPVAIPGPLAAGNARSFHMGQILAFRGLEPKTLQRAVQGLALLPRRAVPCADMLPIPSDTRPSHLRLPAPR